jgi:hypothetical protein
LKRSTKRYLEIGLISTLSAQPRPTFLALGSRKGIVPVTVIQLQAVGRMGLVSGSRGSSGEARRARLLAVHHSTDRSATPISARPSSWPRNIIKFAFRRHRAGGKAQPILLGKSEGVGPLTTAAWWGGALSWQYMK